MNKGIQEIFNTVPKTYELINHVLTFGLDIAWRKRLARKAAGFGGSLWLDICSGTGETAGYLRRLAPEGVEVVAADFCEPMLSEARKKSDKIKFTIGDATKLPFPDNKFDLVTISFATRNLNISREMLTKTFAEFRRVLKPGGRFLNLETSQPDSKIIRKLFHTYIGLSVKPIGILISGSKSGYKYLSHTIPRFYDAATLAEVMKDAGFQTATFDRMMFGAAAIHTAVK